MTESLSYRDWCRLCGSTSTISEIFIDVALILESIFELPVEESRLCFECHESLTNLHSLIISARKLSKMFTGLDEENKEDLNLVRLNAYRSHFNLAPISEEDPDEIEIQNFEPDEPIIEEVVEEYLEDILVVEEVIAETSNDIEMDELEDSNIRKNDYEKLFVFKCHLCEHPEFSKMNDLMIHCKLQHNKAVPMVKCCSDQCGKMLSTWRRLIIHKEMHFPSNNVMKCNICKRVFSTKLGFEKHQKLHTTPYVCTFCAKVFKEPKTLRWHEATHLKSVEERRNFECNHCGLKFITKQACQNHIGMKHEKIVSFYCGECGKGFFTKKAMYEHQRTHGDRKFACDFCDFKSKTSSGLRTHMEVHADVDEAEKFSCDKCEMSFVSLRRLKSHIVCHSTEAPHECQHCSAKFKRAKDLKNHINTHSGVRSHACNFCPRNFTNSSNCRKHKLKEHAEELKEFEAMNGSGRKLDCYN